MPRPKRTKVAPSAPAPRLKQVTKPPVAAVAEAPKAPFNDLYDVSDPEERAVTGARLVRKSIGKAKAVASPSKKTVTERANKTERAEEIYEPQRDRAQAEASDAEPILDDIDLESSSPAVEVGRRESSLAPGDSVMAIGNFHRRARQPSILGRGAGRHRSSSVESNLAYDNGFTSVGQKNTSAIGNFRRRPREESIMGRNVAPSSMGLEMERGTTPQVGSALKLGNFKRREREPSILRTGQKAPRQQLEYEDNDEDEDEDDFNPDDESTPLNNARSRNVTSSSGVSSSNSRKRKLSAVQVPQSSPTLPPQGEVDADDSIPATGEHSDQEGEQEQGLSEPIMPSVEGCSDTPELLSETMAPPLSSSPAPSSPDLPSRMIRAPSRSRRPLRGKTPPPRTQHSPITSPPSLTHSPNRPSVTTTKPKPKPKRQVPPPSTLSTAQLQALLPRRRHRPAHNTFSIPSSEDEVDVSGLASDDDELSHLDVRARNRASTALPRQTPAPRRKVTKLKGPTKPVPKTGGKRTYGRANPTTSDKENAGEEEVDPDDSLAPLPDDGNESPENSQELEKRVGKELKQAARKFAEVDKWELEFEEVTASSSSPKDAR